MTRFYLIRHAQAEGNIYQRMHGWYDSGITSLGDRQIAALTGRFDGTEVDMVYASDLYRCRRTAEAIYVHHGLPLHTDRRFREISMGAWEDRPFAEVALHEGEEYRNFFTLSPSFKGAEGGETFQQVQRRVVEALHDLAEKHPGKTIAVVAHAMAIRAALAWLHGYGDELSRVKWCENTSVSCVEYEDGAWNIRYESDAHHLPLEICSVRSRTAGRGNNLWFRPWKREEEEGFYTACRHEAWIDIHGTGEPFFASKFYNVAKKASEADERMVMIAMMGEKPVGIIQMDNHPEEDVLFVPFCYLDPETRHRGLGVQLLGQAVSTGRMLGRSKLRLRCAPTNRVAKRFYERNGFRFIGMAQDSEVTLELLEKDFSKPDGSKEVILT